MRIGLTTRVIITLALVGLVVVGVAGVLTRWSFQRQFLAYVEAREEEQLDAIAEVLIARHLRDGDLEALLRPEVMRSVLTEALGGRWHGRPGRGRHPPDGPAGNPPPPPGTPTITDRQRAPRAGGPRVAVLPRLRIIDPEGRQLFPGLRDQERPAAGVEAGERSPTRRRRLSTPAGDAVATLEVRPLRELVSPRDLSFSRNQSATMAMIAAASALLAAAVGWALAVWLLRPLTDITRAVRRLADGDHQVRVDLSRSDELGALARDVERLARTLAASADARDRWLADIAHELRTPLSVLRGELDALRDGVRPFEPGALDSLDDELRRLTTLVEDLRTLTLADAGAHARRHEDVDLAALVEATLRRYRDRLAQAGLALEVPVDDAMPPDAHHVDGDPDHLERMLANLLENSLRYTDAPGRVVLRLEARDGEQLLSVEDSGPGVPEADLGQVFERFHRPDAARTRATGGSGLGLAIVARIVESHGGRAQATASELGGLRVLLALPGSVGRTEEAPG